MQPHPLLTAHYQSPDEKQRFLRKVFDRGAPYYDRIINWSSLGSGQWYRGQALQRGGLKPGMRVLDVASGTAATARAAARILGNTRAVIGLDPSSGMLREAQKRLPSLYVQGVADHLPVRAGAFDFLTMGYALRHVENLAGTFREYFRVLKPGGRVLLLEITKPNHRWATAVMRFYFGGLLPRLTQWFSRSRDAGEMMRYYWETIERMVPPARVLEALTAAGFANVARGLVLGVFSEYQATKPRQPVSGRARAGGRPTAPRSCGAPIRGTTRNVRGGR